MNEIEEKMNEAQKFIQKSIKTFEIDGSKFTIRKLNPYDSFLMNSELRKVREKAKEKAEECEDCPDEEKKPFKLSMDDLSVLREEETKIVLTRCVISPKIVLKPFGEQKKDEVPYELVDSKTAIGLFEEIQKFSLEVAEGVSLDSFPDQQGRDDLTEDELLLEHATKLISGELPAESDGLPEDSSGRGVHKSKGTRVKNSSEKSKERKRQTRRDQKEKNERKREIPKKSS